MSNVQHFPRYRLNANREVIRDDRRMSIYYGTDDYIPGRTPLFAVKRSSPARDRFKAERRARRAAARAA